MFFDEIGSEGVIRNYNRRKYPEIFFSLRPLNACYIRGSGQNSVLTEAIANIG